MRRHLHYQKRFGVLTAAVALVILGVVGTIGWYTNHYHNNSAHNTQAHKAVYHKPANPVSAAADSFIIAKVGQDRFLKYFKAIEVKAADPAAGSIGGAPVDLPESGFRSYHFSLLKTVTPNDTVIVIVNLKTPELTISNLVPDCQKDKSFCNFKITKKQALAIAKKHNFSPSDIKASWERPIQGTPALAIKLSSCAESKVMFIDYRNGKVLDFHPEMVCPKINPLLNLPASSH